MTQVNTESAQNANDAGSSGSIGVTVDGPIAIVTIDRPRKLNAMTRSMIDDFRTATSELDADPSVRAIVITGAGERSFSAGGDLNTLLPPAMDAADDLLNPVTTDRFLSSVFTPVIAAVRGLCIGAGFEILLGTDIRVASTDAAFGLPEVKWGLVPGSGTHVRLPQQVSWPVAMKLLLTGESIDAQTALTIGLVNETVASDRVLDRALEIAGVVAKNGPLAVRTAKEIAVRALDHHGAFALEHALNSRVLGSNDAREGVAAFQQKRDTTFVGR
ncbi:enoyl-CoA hydratase/isomerase family protein [Rhodococcoides kyotonense]|uniref:Enoyl-CoA hydratase n=1 Tax=Rhodococcoides kyotonense TaxID=398843 RepID=A0A177YLR9_9NOCA|nr:enoyl-CoA hydratase/isomerase family protein [Rhodococcus kyotonensis]OAK56200.1 enoyl-CoA hydratase [Rhodococcus kyotonensis]